MKKTRVSGALIAVFVCTLLGWTITHRNTRSTAHAQQVAEATVIPDSNNYSLHYSYDGLSLAPVSMRTSSDSSMLASLLNAQILKFTAKTTKPNMIVTYILEVREKGQPTKIISNFAFGPFGGNIKPGVSNFYVGFLPLNGNIEDADKVKYEIMTGDTAQAAVIDNPFKDCSYYGTPAIDSTQKDIPLLSAYVQKEAGTLEKTLYLRLQTKVGK